MFDVAGFGGFVLVSGQNDSSKIHPPVPPDQVQDFKLRFRSERCRKSYFLNFWESLLLFTRYLIV